MFLLTIKMALILFMYGLLFFLPAWEGDRSRKGSCTPVGSAKEERQSFDCTEEEEIPGRAPETSWYMANECRTAG